VDGRKGPGDVLVLVDAEHEPLNFAEWLFIGAHYLASEDSYYPRNKGYAGSEYLMNALNDLVYNGLPIEVVLRKYKLENGLNITDKRLPAARGASGRVITNLAEILT
jgi:hypothetical protein